MPESGEVGVFFFFYFFGNGRIETEKMGCEWERIYPNFMGFGVFFMGWEMSVDS